MTKSLLLNNEGWQRREISFVSYHKSVAQALSLLFLKNSVLKPLVRTKQGRPLCKDRYGEGYGSPEHAIRARSEWEGCLGMQGCSIHVTASAGKEGNRNSCGRLATYEEKLSNK